MSNPELSFKAPRVALLGICERARFQIGTPPALSHADIIGLRQVALSLIYPFDLSRIYLVLAVYGLDELGLGHVILRDRAGNQIFRLDMELSGTEQGGQGEPEKRKPDMIVPIALGDSPAWNVIFAPLRNLVLNEPQAVEALLIDDSQETSLGMLAFGYASAPPLAPDRIAAIRSDPRAVKAVQLEFGCRYCDSKLRVYAALDKASPAAENATWYQDLPDSFDCKCGMTHTPLNIVRSNLHAVLGEHQVNQGNISFSTQYEQRALNDVAQKLSALLDTDPPEEEVQKFLSQNPIIFHFLSPQRLFEKPPILSKHQADFAILDSRRTLVYIEIERPGIRLLRKDGAASAEMEHAVSQVRDWLFFHEKHRGAVLECLNLRDEEVTKARGLVIAGRDKGYEAEHIRRFKWQDRGLIECITYDDLLGMLAALSREMNRM